MKFSINQSEFNATLATVSKGASSRSTLPILSGILIRAQDNNLTLETTDMDLSIRCVCPALIESEGESVVPAKLLNDVVKNLPDAAIHFESGLDAATILCDTSSFSIKTLDAQDFPGFPDVEEQTKVTLPFKTFSSMVKKVARVTSRDESRAILSGVLIEKENGTLRMVATDSYRLAMEEASVEKSETSFSAVIPGSFLNDLAALSGEHDTIDLALSENQIIARYGLYTFISRRIEGNYPNYTQMLADTFDTTIKFNTKQFLEAVKRVSLVSNNSTSPLRFDINSGSQTTQISTTSQDIGTAQETISSQVEGVDTQIAFNGHFLLDGLTAFTEETIQLGLQGGVKPGIFKNDSGSFIYLIMPVRSQ